MIVWAAAPCNVCAVAHGSCGDCGGVGESVRAASPRAAVVGMGTCGVELPPLSVHLRVRHRMWMVPTFAVIFVTVCVPHTAVRQPDTCEASVRRHD